MDLSDAFAAASAVVDDDDDDVDFFPEVSSVFACLSTEERRLSDLLFRWLYQAAGGPAALSRAEQEEEQEGRGEKGREASFCLLEDDDI